MTKSNGSWQKKWDEINALALYIIEQRKKNGDFQVVENELKKLWDSLFDPKHEDTSGIIEYYLRKFNRKYSYPLNREELRDALSEAACTFFEKLAKRQVDSEKCQGRVINFIIGILYWKFREAVSQKFKRNKHFTPLERYAYDGNNQGEPKPFLEIDLNEKQIQDLEKTVLNKIDLEKIVSVLSVTQLDLFFLKVILDLDYDDIRKMYAISYDSARQRVSRLMKYLRNLIKLQGMFPDIEIDSFLLLDQLLIEMQKHRPKSCTNKEMKIKKLDVAKLLIDSRLHDKHRHILLARFIVQKTPAAIMKKMKLSREQYNLLFENAKRRFYLLAEDSLNQRGSIQ